MCVCVCVCVCMCVEWGTREGRECVSVQEQGHEKKAGFMGLVECFCGVCPTSEITE